jgi:hypothetical protein
MLYRCFALLGVSEQHYVDINMPRLLTAPRRKRATPPCGRIIATAVPHSPFQTLIDAKRIEKGYTFRSLAAAMKKAGGKVSHNTLWLWINGPSGYPSTYRFTRAHLAALSSALQIPESEIRQALDNSLHRFTPKQDLPHAPVVDGFSAFISAIANDKRKRLDRMYILNLAKRLHQPMEDVDRSKEASAARPAKKARQRRS